MSVTRSRARCCRCWELSWRRSVCSDRSGFWNLPDHFASHDCVERRHHVPLCQLPAREHGAAAVGNCHGVDLSAPIGPVFGICLITLLLTVVLSVDTMSRYVSYPLASTVLPLLGIVMASICLLRSDRFLESA